VSRFESRLRAIERRHSTGFLESLDDAQLAALVAWLKGKLKAILGEGAPEPRDEATAAAAAGIDQARLNEWLKEFEARVARG
jgi:hypothetical protein